MVRRDFLCLFPHVFSSTVTALIPSKREKTIEYLYVARSRTDLSPFSIVDTRQLLSILRMTVSWRNLNTNFVIKRNMTSRMSRREKIARRDYLLLISTTITIFESHTFFEWAFHFSLRATYEFEGHCLFAAGTFHPRSPLWITLVACPFRYLPVRSMGVRY